jgi:hypothetical protein
MKINQKLSQQFLTSHGVEFNGMNFVIKGTDIKLISTDDESTFMVNIPNLPLNIQQPKPISTYSELIRLMLDTLPAYLTKGKDMKTKEELEASASAIVQAFSFDPEIKVVFALSPMGVQIVPGNEYTFTLIQATEMEFKVFYTISGEEHEDEFSISPECVSTHYLKSYLARLHNIDQNVIEISSVSIKVNDAYEVFVGSGLKFNYK